MDFALSKQPGRQFEADALFTAPDFSAEPSQAARSAGLVNIANTYGSMRENSVDYSRLGKATMEGTAEEKIAAMRAEAGVTREGLTALGGVIRAENIGSNQKQAADKAYEGAVVGQTLATLGQVGGALLAFSDQRTKDHIKSIDDALEVLRELRPVTFHYKDDWSYSPERMHHGFIAQEFMGVVPDATYFDESTERYCIDTGDLIGLLVRGIQQLETRVQYLEAQKALAGVK